MRRADPHPLTAAIAARTAAELAEDLTEGRTTSAALVAALLERIEAIDGDGPVALHSILALATDALEVAERLDRERASGHLRGPLHGLPILVKDSIEALGLPGTAGSLALAGRPVTGDAPLVATLRDAGLVVLGATNLSEWANIRSARSTSGWSAVGGLTRNPWALDRSAGGSSSGSGAALAAGLAPLAIGTETDGSITCPASLNGCVGLKPTVGVLPTRGIVPLSSSQDSPGPMARTVGDVALLLDAVLGSSTAHAAACASGTLEGVRLAVADGWRSGHEGTDAAFDAALATLREHGAETNVVEVTTSEGVGDDELTVLLVELREDLDAYLGARGGAGPRSLSEVVVFNHENAERELQHFGQELLEQALTLPGRDSDVYREARRRCLAWAVDGCLAPALPDDGGADVIVAPAFAPAWRSDLVAGDASIGGGVASAAPSIAGWPVLSLPMAVVDGLPVGMALIARPRDEARLLAVACAVEDALGLAMSGALAPAWRAAADD